MRYVAHTAHLQFSALVVGFCAWILTMVTAGHSTWRLWYVSDTSVVSSGQAWVGLWRACFYSHALGSFETCRAIGIADAFAPVDIRVSQVLVMLAVVFGLAANASAAVAVRSVYFSVDEEKRDGRVFRAAGFLHLLTAACLLVALAWNVRSVLTDAAIPFPPEFCLPSAPERQEVGSAIGVGYFAAALLLVCGTIFLCYSFPKEEEESPAGPEAAAAGVPQEDPLHGPWTVSTLVPNVGSGDHQGKDNPAFHAEEE